VIDGDGAAAEFGVLVRSDLKRRGVGTKLLRALAAAARERGVTELRGEVLHENAAMLALARKLGATIDTATHSVYARVTFRFDGGGGAP
jgi:acetyltransferase